MTSQWHAKRVLLWTRFPWIWKLFAVVALVNVGGLAVDLWFRPVDQVALVSNLFGLVVFASLTVLALHALRGSEPTP